MARTSEWAASVPRHPSRNLIAANDGSTRRLRERDPWHTLAIFATKRPDDYVGSIQFFCHPSKEPFHVTRDVSSAVQVAVFFIAYDPAAVLREHRNHAFTEGQIRCVYELQVEALLADFDKTAPIYRR